MSSGGPASVSSDAGAGPLREPMYALGERRFNGAVVVEHEFDVEDDGSTTEFFRDSAGISQRFTVGPDDHYVRHGPTAFDWPASGVFVAYIHRFERVERSVPFGAQWVSTARSPWECFEVFRALWERCADRPFVILNHDVICRPDVLAQFKACPEPWCRFGYCEIPENVITGCTRYRPELANTALDILASMRGPQRRWNVVGEVFAQRLEELGHRAHVHTPPVEHLGPDGEPLPVTERRENPRRFERAVPPKKETR